VIDKLGVNLKGHRTLAGANSDWSVKWNLAASDGPALAHVVSECFRQKSQSSYRPENKQQPY